MRGLLFLFLISFAHGSEYDHTAHMPFVLESIQPLKKITGVDSGALVLLSVVALKLDKVVIAHSGVRPKGRSDHHPSVMHSVGGAIDFHFAPLFVGLSDACSMYEDYYSMVDELDELGVLKYTAIGVYSQWNNPGFHFSISKTTRRWSEVDGVYVGIGVGLTLAEIECRLSLRR